MGLTNSNDSNKTYVTTFKGKFVKKVKEGTEGAVTRTNKIGNVVHELQFDTLSGVLIKSIEKKVTDEYGANWDITLKEADECFVLNLPYSGKVTNGLLFRLPNIDFSKALKLKMFTNSEGKTYLTVYDDLTDAKIPAAYTKENPNGLPEAVQEMRKGKMEWVYDAQEIYIESMIETLIQPKLLAQTIIQSEAPAPEIDDDLPFS